MIKAIETHYNGYRFRSRLEARWAVFFDALGAKYEYEPDGYDLQDAGYYLPDFRCEKIYFEVKYGDRTNWINNTELDDIFSSHRKWVSFSKHIDDLVVVWGDPLEKDYTFFFGGHAFPERKFEKIHNGPPWWSIKNKTTQVIHSPKESALIARQARFEHGETPSPPSPR